ncbi:tetratricopeptide repeat protein [Paenibacillus hodogayensis]|uniref:Tetratricopeptide repeat protein n=1 Tax=Paenibacillus hodogayensis TaxID=279208 RepID=A0ABV5VRJ1_9BACL
MSKFFLFALIWWLVGNPFLALLVMLVLLYMLDRRFIGLSPSLVKPFRRNRKLSRLKRELALSPHHAGNKLEAARLYIEKQKYAEALDLLEQVRPIYDSADVVYEIGLCRLKLGELEEGRRLIEESLDMNPRVKYGEPYLRLGEAFASISPEEAIGYLERFRQANSSSCEGCYKLGRIYERLGNRAEAKRAYADALQLYRGLPRYKRRVERRWAILSKWRQLF